MRRVVVIGGGASGLMAALTAAEDSHNAVTLLERQSRVGRKLLSTGNGRCNLSNLHTAPSRYHGGTDGFVNGVLSQFGVEDTLAWFGKHGLVTAAEADGKIYPYSNMANSVVDVLRFGLNAGHVALVAGAAVEALERRRDDFLVRTAEQDFEADAVILACGGAAGSKLGGVMDGYRLLQSLGHHRTALYPSLVQIRTEPVYPRALKGVKAQAYLVVKRGGEILAHNQGEILFTEYGVSGPAVFEISRCVSVSGGHLLLQLDFWHAASQDEILAYLCAQRMRRGTLESGQLLTGVVNNRLGQMICKAAGFTAQKAATLTDSDLQKIAWQCQHFSLPILGVCGFDSAQVTAGGIQTGEFDPDTLESRLIPGLYACGEVLDIDGDCGGFNLQWAWSSGRVAGLLKGAV
jgi:predicted Rossmann fold flavoprotein